MPSRYGTAGRSRGNACPGLPEAFALEWEQGNHTPSPGAELRQGDKLCESGTVIRDKWASLIIFLWYIYKAINAKGGNINGFIQ